MRPSCGSCAPELRFAALGEAGDYQRSQVASPEHRALARESAQKSIVLLKNEPVDATSLLPLDLNQVKRIAILGELATVANIGDHGSSRVRPPEVITPLEGLQAALPPEVALLSYSGKSARRAANLARQAEVAIVIAGYRHNDEGEYMARELDWLIGGGDRTSLRLPPAQEKMIQAVAAANPRTVVVVIGGGPVIMEAWRERVPAILMAWYPGMEGGHAIADILLGKVNPSAKLPCSFPRSAEHLPFFDPQAEEIEYGYFHGYWLLDREDHPAAFPFGHGLSYTKFDYDRLSLNQTELSPDGVLEASIAISNRGSRAGAEIAQLYVGYPQSRVERPVRQLKGFRRLELAPGQSQTVRFELPASELAYYDEQRRVWTVAPGDYEILVGPSSRRSELNSAAFRIKE